MDVDNCVAIAATTMAMQRQSVAACVAGAALVTTTRWQRSAVLTMAMQLALPAPRL